MLQVSVATDSELETLAESAGVDPLGRAVERIRALEGSWDVVDEVNPNDNGRMVTVATDFNSPADFQVRYGELLNALDAPEARLLGPLTITVDDEADLLTVRGELPLQITQVAAADLGSDVPSLTAQLQGVVDSTLTITTPGSLIESDAGAVTVEGQVVSSPYQDGPAALLWQALPGQVTPVLATFEPGGADLLRWALLGGGAVVAFALIGAGLWAGRRSR